MILLSALLEIFLVLLLLEDESEADDNDDDEDDEDDELLEDDDGEGETTCEHNLHDHARARDDATFRCTVIFLHMEHDLRSGESVGSFELCSILKWQKVSVSIE